MIQMNFNRSKKAFICPVISLKDHILQNLADTCMSWLQNTHSRVKKHAEDVILQPVTVQFIRSDLGHQSAPLGPSPTPPSSLNRPAKSTLKDFREPCPELKGGFYFAFASLPSRCPQEALGYSSFFEQNGAAWMLQSVSPGEMRSGRDPRIFRWPFPLHRRTHPPTILSCFCFRRPDREAHLFIHRDLGFFPLGRNSRQQQCPIHTAFGAPLIVCEPPTNGAIKILGCAYRFLSVVLNSCYIVS